MLTWPIWWPNIFVWLILHGLDHCEDHRDHRHNHTYKTFLWEGSYVFVKDIWKRKENAWNITLYQLWLRWFSIDGISISFCTRKFLCVFHSIRVSTSLHLPSKNSHTCACAMYAISIDILFVPPCLTPWIHPKSTFEKKRFYWALDLNWLWFLNLTHVYKLVKMCTYNTHFLH
jgi:hypothetical protein